MERRGSSNSVEISALRPTSILAAVLLNFTDLVLPGGHVSKNRAKEIGSGIAWASGELDVSASFGSSDIRKRNNDSTTQKKKGAFPFHFFNLKARQFSLGFALALCHRL